MKIWKKNYPQVYLEKCKYKIRKRKMPGFTDVELESDSSSGSEWLQFSAYWEMFSNLSTQNAESGLTFKVVLMAI